MKRTQTSGSCLSTLPHFPEVVIVTNWRQEPLPANMSQLTFLGFSLYTVIQNPCSNHEVCPCMQGFYSENYKTSQILTKLTWKVNAISVKMSTGFWLIKIGHPVLTCVRRAKVLE